MMHVTLFKDRFRTETTRLRGWDYAAHAWYFVTICTRDRICYLGDVSNGIASLSSVGKTVERCWRAIPDHFPDVGLDDFVIMPNHLHGIVLIGRTHRFSPNLPAPDLLTPRKLDGIQPGSLPAVIRSFKSAVTRWCGLNGQPRSIWQPRYYDQVIRRSVDLERLRGYIASNPFEWPQDELRPGGSSSPQ